MPIQIRLATPSDIPQLSTLLASLFAQEVEFVPDPAVQARGLNMIISNPTAGRVLVVVDDAQVVGMVNLLLTVSTALGKPVALLEDLIIAPSHQQRGLGKQLIHQAFEMARSLGCARITLLTDADNLKAQAFYQAQGFAPSSMLPLRKMLEP